jgi:GntR family transcriptional regulator
MSSLLRSSEGTLHHQLHTELVEQIDSGKIGVGDRLPSEADLVRDYDVSRTTARRALDELRRQGLVRREPGRGTFLVSPRLRSDLAYLYSFSEEIERWGYEPGARLISRKETGADKTIAKRLGVDLGEKVLYIRRLRLADDQPIFVCDSYLPVVRFPELRDADYGSVSLRVLFEETIGRKFARAQQWIEAAAAPGDIAGLLDVESGTPVLKIERVTFVDGDEPIENVEAFFHPERYRHYNELSSQPVGLAG